jgi:hypothetical protein
MKRLVDYREVERTKEKVHPTQVVIGGGKP